MSRWIHAVFGLTALAAVVGVVVFWPTPAALPPTARPGGRGTTPATPPAATPRPSQPTAPGATVPTCPERPVSPLNVLTFNIHGGLGHGRLDLRYLADEIAGWRPDVVLLQEVDRYRLRTGVVDQAAWLGRALDMHVAYGANKRRAPARAGLPRAAIGNAILSRTPIRGWRNVHLPNRPGLELRGLLRAEIEVDGQPLSVYVTHLQHTSAAVRIEQASAIRALLATDPLPKIVGGDLNAEQDSPAVRTLLRTGLQDTWRSVGEGPGLTVPNGSPHRRIDYVLHDPGIRPLAARALHSGLSDHRAVLASLDLSGLGSCPERH